MESAAGRVLRVSELLLVIFSYLKENHKRSLREAACVCKCWSSVALDALYEEMELEDLLRSIAPVEEIHATDDESEDERDQVHTQLFPDFMQYLSDFVTTTHSYMSDSTCVCVRISFTSSLQTI
jgi:hypothetical protein